MYSRLNPTSPIPCHSQEFYAIAEFTGKSNIFWGQSVDTFSIDAIDGNRGTIGNGDQNGQLVGCVRAIHIKGRRVLRISKIYGLLHRLTVRELLLRHSG